MMWYLVVILGELRFFLIGDWAPACAGLKKNIRQLNLKMTGRGISLKYSIMSTCVLLDNEVPGKAGGKPSFPPPTPHPTSLYKSLKHAPAKIFPRKNWRFGLEPRNPISAAWKAEHTIHPWTFCPRLPAPSAKRYRLR